MTDNNSRRLYGGARMDVSGASSQGIANVFKVKMPSVIKEAPSELDEKKDEETEVQQRTPSIGMLDKQVESMNKLLEFNHTAIRFNLHEGLGRMYVQVISRDTDEVVKEIPPEQFLDMVASMLQHAGLLIDKKV